MGFVTYSASFNHFVLQQYDENDPATLNDIYTADQVNGWGKIFRVGVNQYLSNAKIIVGTGTEPSWFVIDTETLIFDSCLTKIDDDLIALNSACGLEIYQSQIGCLDLNYLNPRFIRGPDSYDIKVMIDTAFFYHPSNGIIFRAKNATAGMVDLRNIISTNVYLINCEGSFKDVKINGGTYGLVDIKGTLDNVTAEGSQRGLYFSGGQIQVTGLRIRSISSWAIVVQNASAPTDYLDLVDIEIPYWTFFWYSSSPDAHIKRSYTFNMFIDDNNGLGGIPNAKVVLFDREGFIVVDEDTDANGYITEQIVLSHDYTWNGVEAANDDYRGPFTLQVTATGYDTYIASGFEIEEPINQRLHLAGDGPGTKSIAGKVYRNGEPLIGAQVLLYRVSDNKFVQSTYTVPLQGQYSFSNLPAEDYFVVCLPPDPAFNAQVFYSITAE